MAAAAQDSDDPLEELISVEAVKELIDVALKKSAPGPLRPPLGAGAARQRAGGAMACTVPGGAPSLTRFPRAGGAADTYQEPYPMADKKTGKKCRQAIITLWRTLLEKLKHEVIYDDVFLVNVVNMISIMSGFNHRGVRHTAAELGLETMIKLVEVEVELAAQYESKSRQQTGKKKAKGTVHADLAQELRDIEEQQAALGEKIDELFKQVFQPRFRDICDEIRLCCANAVGRLAVLNPSNYVNDNYIKYLAWMCNDSSPLVRAASVTQLAAMYKSAKGALSEISNFTTRFAGRFLELAKDIDGRVTTEALKLIHLLLEYDMLPDRAEAVQTTLPLVKNGDAALLKALAPLLRHQLQHGAEDEEPAAPKPKAKAKAKKKKKAGDEEDEEQEGGDAEQTPKQGLLRLAKLLQAQQAGASGDALDARRTLCSNLVGAMAGEAALFDWAAYCELLLSEDEDAAVQTMLLHLMGAAAASVAAAAAPEAEADPDGTEAVTPRKRQRKVGKKDAAAQDERNLRLSAQLGKSLPQLLSTFGNDREPLVAVLGLLQQLQLPAAQATLKGQRFGDLLQQLEAVCTKHTDADALQACGGAWRALLRQKDANAMLTKVQVGYKRLGDKLLLAVKPLAQQLRGKQTPQLDFAEAEVAMRRLQKLSVQPVQPLPLLHGLAPRLLALAEAKKGAPDPHLLGTTQTLLELQVEQLVLAATELQGLAKEGDAAGVASDLQQKRGRMQRAVHELLPSLVPEEGFEC